MFRELDLTIEAGRSLAIVGDNGAGKTTLVKLLARLYDPGAGRITVDGIDLRSIDPARWHRRVAAIFQDYVQFELTAQDNVAFGALDRARRRPGGGARPPSRRARRPSSPGCPRAGTRRSAASSATGPSCRAGSGSGWRWPGRCSPCAPGAGLLVLDEPTAALDVRGEAQVYDRFLELTRGITTIVISHRFSTVRRADRIVVLEHGEVVEDGTHDQLIARAAATPRCTACRRPGSRRRPERGRGRAMRDRHAATDRCGRSG